MRIVRLNIKNLKWDLLRDHETCNWVAVCDQLGITISGETFAELQECIGEALDALFKDLLADNELDDFFRERGWSLQSPVSPSDIPSLKFDIPWFLPTPSENDPALSVC